jgi:hypothetical protein
MILLFFLENLRTVGSSYLPEAGLRFFRTMVMNPNNCPDNPTNSKR